MEVVLIIVTVYVVWRIIKYIVGSFIMVDRLYHALKDIRIATFQNPEVVSEIFNIEFDKGEVYVKGCITIIILSVLKSDGYNIEYIQGNYKLRETLTEAVEDIYQIVKEKQGYIDVI